MVGRHVNGQMDALNGPNLRNNDTCGKTALRKLLWNPKHRSDRLPPTAGDGTGMELPQDAQRSMETINPGSGEQAPRILFLDDNIRDIGGHYLELAALLCTGATELGYRCELVTNESLCADDLASAGDGRLAGVPIHPEFSVRRMERWSLGVDGAAWVARNAEGSPWGGKLTDRLRQRIAERTGRRKRRPKTMLAAWTRTFEKSVSRFQPSQDDRIVVNTGSDFQLIALARAVERLKNKGLSHPLHIHVVFHFAVFDRLPGARAQAFGAQVRQALQTMSGHRIALHATTGALAEQLATVGLSATAIPYPTRCRAIKTTTTLPMERLKVVLAGIPRAEKGKDHIRSLLQEIEPVHLRSGRMSWSMQVPQKRWRRYVPESMNDLLQQQSSCDVASSGPSLELMHGNLSVEAYHDWLDSAELGMFLYEPQRYVARCSGVLLEMMVRGVPVIVPDGCWLADQVRDASVDSPVGWIYSRPDQIPALLDRVANEIDGVRMSCRKHALRVAQRHGARNTLLQMGVPNRTERTILVAG